ncbi:MAG: DUF4390 domain-containing protein [Spirochaetaceae bacterium]
MRKSSFFPTLCFLLLSLTLHSQESHLDAGRMGERFTFTMELAAAPEAKILEALKEGMRSEVEYRVQLYREIDGIWRFFGDRLIEEYETHHIAYFDPFTRSYKIAATGAFAKGERSFEEPEAFLREFLSIRSTPVKLPLEGSDYWIRGRAVIRPVRVAPPLGLIGVFLPNQRYGTAWTSAEL